MEIKAAVKADIPLIHTLAEKIWKLHYPGIITMEQIEYMLEKMYSPQALEAQMTEGHCFYILYHHDQACGYLSFSKKGPGEYFLHKFYIDTTRHRKGMGSFFFDQVFKSIPDLQSVRLTVNRSNYKAINFYFKTGFTIEEVKDFDIGNGYQMNDFVMVKQIVKDQHH
ncbi:MAG: GNAT family N-acetyltransferase [Bacteroidia bacterium]|nr:GNAT family N-acetyltransferase [Bacteroidia bacterium]